MPKAMRMRAGASVPSRVEPTGLQFTCTPDGQASQVIDLTAWAGSEEIRRAAVVALEKLTAVDGLWRSRQTIQAGLRYVRDLLAWCDQRGVERFADLHVDLYRPFEEGKRNEHTASSMVSLLSHVRPFLRIVEGLPAATRWEVKQRVGAAPSTGERDYLTTPQMFDLGAAALRVVSQARHRVRANYAHLEAALGSDAPSPAQQMLVDIWDDTHRSAQYHRRKKLLGSPEPATGWTMADHFFMLTQEEVVAAAVLLVVRTGWNLSVVETLTTGSWAASTGNDEDIATVSLDKPRGQANRHSTRVLVDNGPKSQGAAWRLIVEATDPTRAYLAHHGVETDTLLLRAAHSRPGLSLLYGRTRKGLPKEPNRALGWLPDDVGVDFPALRRTHQTLMDRTPNLNTFKTHMLSYLALSPEVKAEVHATIASGQTSMLSRAEESLVVRMQAEGEVSPDLRDGAKDTATVACKDINHHPVTGLPCTDSFLACLMCLNAVATPRHLPRLVLLHSALEDMRATLTESAWLPWGDHYLRLHAFLFHSARLTDETYRRHLQGATTTDRQNVRDLLGGHLDA